VGPKADLHAVVKPNTCIYCVILLFFVPLKWLIAWLLAIGMHEFSHWAAVKICGGRVTELTVGIGGIQMRSTCLTNSRRLICILSGPVGGFLLILLGRWLPRTALISWMLSVYNLLPFRFLDGGKALEILVGDRVAAITGNVFAFLLSVCAVYAALLLGMGGLPLVIVAILWAKNRKRPCKPRVCKVQ